MDPELREALGRYLLRARDGRELHKYWTSGPGLARWVDDPHPFKTLLAFLLRHMPETKARKTAHEWFKEVKGFAPSGRPPDYEGVEEFGEMIDTTDEPTERERKPWQANRKSGKAKARRRTARRSEDLEVERANELKKYWLHGAGAGRWARWTELYNHLRKHLSDERAKRVAAEWFHERYGYWPGADKNRVAHGKPPRGERIGPG